jgi:hypothetical protein
MWNKASFCDTWNKKKYFHACSRFLRQVIMTPYFFSLPDPFTLYFKVVADYFQIRCLKLYLIFAERRFQIILQKMLGGKLLNFVVVNVFRSYVW